MTSKQGSTEDVKKVWREQTSKQGKRTPLHQARVEVERYCNVVGKMALLADVVKLVADKNEMWVASQAVSAAHLRAAQTSEAYRRRYKDALLKIADCGSIREAERIAMAALSQLDTKEG